ncbi:hypothetical protein FDP41_011692 [Naegleria fowleri]|uniref:TatD related DNase n=1 Tax=Naegleria fowleri TaxID=5763 RepID=A0A6A5C428_NAEFO|nr:uncharacterized protein FDP41_011692 [Naegleria fowleri]KAF0981831.1 hypothetical protein FDP41_011692 [Naegleria fowleri]CAG4712465.1 unnamed protein product [Naegleria fowleri]
MSFSLSQVNNGSGFQQGSSSSGGFRSNNQRNGSSNNSNYNRFRSEKPKNTASNSRSTGTPSSAEEGLEAYNKQALAELVEILDETPDLGFVDTHVHFEYILQRMFNAQLGEVAYSEKKLMDTLCFETKDKNLYERILSRMNAFVCVQCDPTSFSSLGLWRDLLEMKNLKIGVTFGLHPHNASYYDEKMQDRINQCIAEAGDKCVAYGECGLDYHYNNSPREQQMSCFAKQLQNAVALSLPVVIHAREAEEDAFNIMIENLPKDWKIHVHCFTDREEFAKKLISHFPNLYIGFTGVVTYAPRGNSNHKDQNLEGVIRSLPLERILLETDGPYMPVRLSKSVNTGKKRPIAHSGHIPLIAKGIAHIKKVSIKQVFQQCRLNTTNMYGL